MMMTHSYLNITGQNKMVINHLEKLFVTNDAATILRELEVSLLLVFIKVRRHISLLNNFKI